MEPSDEQIREDAKRREKKAVYTFTKVLAKYLPDEKLRQKLDERMREEQLADVRVFGAKPLLALLVEDLGDIVGKLENYKFSIWSASIVLARMRDYVVERMTFIREVDERMILGYISAFEEFNSAKPAFAMSVISKGIWGLRELVSNTHMYREARLRVLTHVFHHGISDSIRMVEFDITQQIKLYRPVDVSAIVSAVSDTVKVLEEQYGDDLVLTTEARRLDSLTDQMSIIGTFQRKAEDRTLFTQRAMIRELSAEVRRGSTTDEWRPSRDDFERLATLYAVHNMARLEDAMIPLFVVEERRRALGGKGDMTDATRGEFWSNFVERYLGRIVRVFPIFRDPGDIALLAGRRTRRFRMTLHALVMAALLHVEQMPIERLIGDLDDPQDIGIIFRIWGLAVERLGQQAVKSYNLDVLVNEMIRVRAERDNITVKAWIRKYNPMREFKRWKRRTHVETEEEKMARRRRQQRQQGPAPRGKPDSPEKKRQKLTESEIIAIAVQRAQARMAALSL